MSTSNEPPVNRPRPDDVRSTASGLIERIRENATSVRQGLLLAGIGGVVLGGLIWIFIRDLSGAALIVVYIGFGLLVIDAGVSWRAVSKFVFGRGGRYGINSVSVLLAFIGMAIAINYLLFWAGGRPNPPGFLRVDTTATKQFIVEGQVQNTLNQLKEPIEIVAFFPTDTALDRASWRETEDLLSEFKRRSSAQPLTYRQVDPELDPTEASSFGVTRYPALVIEGQDSRRREVVQASSVASANDVDIFSTQDIVTGLLVVSQIVQKQVMFISGHSERDVTDPSASEAFGLAADALRRENYLVTNGTAQELGSLIASGDETIIPAVVVLADPRQDLLALDEEVLGAYASGGGAILFMLEPDRTPETIGAFLSRYGIAIGVGEVVDTASFIPPNPTFLQIKRSNQQFPAHEINTGFDVLYMPGSTYIASSVDPASIPVTDGGTPYISQRSIASTTLSSWAETSADGSISYNQGSDQPGPLPVAVSIEAIAELQGQPVQTTDGFVKTSIVIIGDTDFASNQAFSSAKNGDLFINSVNWLAADFELITIRPKESAFRELVLTSPERNFVRWSGWLLMPSLIGMAGVWIWWRRR
jgi:hypothetical protein